MIVGQKIGYARVSTSAQDLSLQKERLADCDRIFEEKSSGKRGTTRPALNEALAYVRNGDVFVVTKLDALAKTNEMAKQKFRPTRRSGFSRTKAYMLYVEILKNRCNAVGRTFCDAIKLDRLARSVHDLMQITQMLQDKNCDLQVLDQELDTSTPTGRLIFHVLAVIGEFERGLITERVNRSYAGNGGWRKVWAQTEIIQSGRRIFILLDQGRCVKQGRTG